MSGQARQVVVTDLEANPPVWPWGMAPPQLATRAQLRQAGDTDHTYRQQRTP